MADRIKWVKRMSSPPKKHLFPWQGMRKASYAERVLAEDALRAKANEMKSEPVKLTMWQRFKKWVAEQWESGKSPHWRPGTSGGDNHQSGPGNTTPADAGNFEPK